MHKLRLIDISQVMQRKRLRNRLRNNDACFSMRNMLLNLFIQTLIIYLFDDRSHQIEGYLRRVWRFTCKGLGFGLGGSLSSTKTITSFTSRPRSHKNQASSNPSGVRGLYDDIKGSFGYNYRTQCLFQEDSHEVNNQPLKFDQVVAYLDP